MLSYLTATSDRKTDRRPRASVGLRYSASNSTIATTDPTWLVLIERRINQLLALPANWDSHGAPAIDFEAAMGAIMFLMSNSLHDMPAPNAMPMGNGGVQIEWHLKGTDLELAFVPFEASTFYYCNAEGKELEGELEQELLIVGSLLRGLPASDEYTTRR